MRQYSYYFDQKRITVCPPHTFQTKIVEKKSWKNFWHGVQAPSRCIYCNIFEEAWNAYKANEG